MSAGSGKLNITMIEKQKQQLWAAISNWDRCREIGEGLKLYGEIDLLVDAFIKEAYKKGVSDGYEDCWNEHAAND